MMFHPENLTTCWPVLSSVSFSCFPERRKAAHSVRLLWYMKPHLLRKVKTYWLGLQNQTIAAVLSPWELSVFAAPGAKKNLKDLICCQLFCVLELQRGGDTGGSVALASGPEDMQGCHVRCQRQKMLLGFTPHQWIMADLQLQAVTHKIFMPVFSDLRLPVDTLLVISCNRSLYSSRS